MKKISIIVPIYNVVDYVERVIKCLINQTYTNLEIILIDDGSNDGSGNICDKYQKKDKRIKVIHQKNSGVSVARNVGLKKATGDYVGFVDGDDYLNAEMIETLYNILNSTNADISVCNFIHFNNEVPDFKNDEINNLKIMNKIEVFKDLLTDGVITSFLWNKLFKKELFDNITFPKNKIYEDLYVVHRIFDKIDKVCYTSQKLYGYFNRSNSYVNTFSKKKNDNYLDFCLERYKYLKKYSELEEELENFRLFYIYSAFLQASKSHCLDIIKSKRMMEEYKIYRNNFKNLNKKVSLKRKMAYYILYINPMIFYRFITLIK